MRASILPSTESALLASLSLHKAIPRDTRHRDEESSPFPHSRICTCSRRMCYLSHFLQHWSCKRVPRLSACRLSGRIPVRKRILQSRADSGASQAAMGIACRPHRRARACNSLPCTDYTGNRCWVQSLVGTRTAEDHMEQLHALPSTGYLRWPGLEGCRSHKNSTEGCLHGQNRRYVG